MTMEEECKAAEAIHNACNSSGVAHRMSKAFEACWEEAHAIGRGTDYVNNHPVVRMFLWKLCDLANIDLADNVASAIYDSFKQYRDNIPTDDERMWFMEHKDQLLDNNTWIRHKER